MSHNYLYLMTTEEFIDDIRRKVESFWSDTPNEDSVQELMTDVAHLLTKVRLDKEERTNGGD